MTKNDIIDLMQAHLATYSLMLSTDIKETNYEKALTNLDVCKAYLITLRFIQEQEEFSNASLQQ